MNHPVSQSTYPCTTNANFNTRYLCHKQSRLIKPSPSLCGRNHSSQKSTCETRDRAAISPEGEVLRDLRYGVLFFLHPMYCSTTVSRGRQERAREPWESYQLSPHRIGLADSIVWGTLYMFVGDGTENHVSKRYVALGEK